MAEVPSTAKRTRLVPIQPDGGWGWVVVMGTFFIHVVADGFVYSFGVLVDVLMKEFESDNTVIAMIVSLLTGFTLGSGPLASAVCNKYGCRATAIMGAIIAITGCTASYFASEMWHIIVSVGIIMGIGSGFMYCPAIVIVTMYFERRRSLATGIAVTGAGVGTMVFSPINDYVMSRYGWRAVFLVFNGVFALCIVCGSLFRPLQFQEIVEEDGAETPDEVNKPNTTSEEVTGALLTAGEAPRPSKVVPEDSQSLASLASSRTDSKCRRRLVVRRESVGERDVGYLNRKDIFYTGAITSVDEFKEDPDKYRSTGSLRRSSISTMSSEILQAIKESPDDVFEDTQEDIDNAEGSNMWKTMSNMLLLSLMFDPIFLLFAISNMLSSVGFNSPLYFLPLHAQKGVGLDSAHSSAVLSAFGLSNSIGRLVYGIIADHKLPLPYGWGSDVARNRLWMYNISLSICGLLTTFCFLFTSFFSLSLYAALHGFFLAAYICLASVILVDLLGLDKLTNAFGLLLLWQGIGTVAGPPIAGYLADITNSYVWSFVFSGINLLVSGLMLFSIPYLQRKRTISTSH